MIDNHPHPARLARAIAAAVLATVCCLAATATAAAALDAGQKQLLAQVEATLKQIETNVKLAQDTAGPGDGPLTGSKARLTATRLADPRAKLPAVAEALKKLPADDGSVAAAQTRADAAGAAIDKLVARIEGKPAGGAAQAGPPPAAGSIKLDYKQVEQLKNARFYLREIEGHRQAVAKVADEVKGVQDANTVKYTLVQQAMNTIAKVADRAKLVENALAKVPADGEGVPPVAAQFKDAMAGLEQSRKVLAPVHARLSALVNPANYPDFEADYKRVQELSRMFANVEVFNTNRELAAATTAQAKPAWEEAHRVYKKYEQLAQQQTPDGVRIYKQCRYFAEQHKAFMAKVAEQIELLPKLIRDDLKQADDLADEAVAKQRPLYFAGGIRNVLDSAEEKLTLLKALSPKAAEPVAKDFERTAAAMKQKKTSLSEAIITANRLPPDRYAGDDKAELTKLAVAEWKKIQPDAKVLAVRFASAEWKREKMWYYSAKTWSLTDRSKLQAQLIVQHDGRLAVNRPVNLWKDHLRNDAVRAAPMFGKVDNDLQPEWFYLLTNVK